MVLRIIINKLCKIVPTSGLNNNFSPYCRLFTTHYRSGALKPKPSQQPFGLAGVTIAVVSGLFIGATISKNMANFLEENDLFVPSDDDDDDD